MRKGTTGRTLGMEIYPLVEFAIAVFMGSIILCTAEDPIGPAIGWGLKPHQGTKQVSLRQDILFSILPSILHHAAKMP